ncbi:unnamed protein product [Brassicogethes aeneus]|uniref:Uncharacterized protein n=1 Tax=Brassicogethes aeneus TaxID=1431903 RepID=A0A9P0BLL8_BRAAE|nr:unnamed protein product [Brassicogethes aeneus]
MEELLEQCNLEDLIPVFKDTTVSQTPLSHWALWASAQGPGIDRGPPQIKYNVVIICQETEKLIRQMSNKFKLKNSAMYISNKVLYNVQSIFSNSAMIDHIKNQDILDNHRILLIKKIIVIFLSSRLSWEVGIIQEKLLQERLLQ